MCVDCGAGTFSHPLGADGTYSRLDIGICTFCALIYYGCLFSTLRVYTVAFRFLSRAVMVLCVHDLHHVHTYRDLVCLSALTGLTPALILASAPFVPSSIMAAGLVCP